MIEQLLNSPRSTKRLISIAYDIVALSAAYFLSKLLRFGSITAVDSPELTCLALTIGTHYFCSISSWGFTERFYAL